MNGSFLRASVVTSVVSFGIAAMAVGVGVVFGLVGFALRARPSPATVCARGRPLSRPAAGPG